MFGLDPDGLTRAFIAIVGCLGGAAIGIGLRIFLIYREAKREGSTVEWI